MSLPQKCSTAACPSAPREGRERRPGRQEEAGRVGTRERLQCAAGGCCEQGRDRARVVQRKGPCARGRALAVPEAPRGGRARPISFLAARASPAPAQTTGTPRPFVCRPALEASEGRVRRIVIFVGRVRSRWLGRGSRRGPGPQKPAFLIVAGRAMRQGAQHILQDRLCSCQRCRDFVDAPMVAGSRCGTRSIPLCARVHVFE